MLASLVKRDIRGRYKGSLLGVLWNIIVPLVQVVVYLLVFTSIFKPNIDNYAIYMITGMVLWFYFADCLSEGSFIMIVNSDMLKKIYFPRSVLPISVVLARFVNFAITLVIMLAIIIVTGYGVSLYALLYTPILIVLFILFMIGSTLMFSALDVYFRDIQYIISVTLMALIWLTPIMYMRGTFDNPFLETILSYNPMTYYVEFMQSIFYWGTAPELMNILICAGLSIGMFIIGILVFNYLEKDFAEVL